MANLLDVTFTGTGSLGEITVASVSNSEATSSSPTDTPAQIGTVSVTGKTTDSSIFLADNDLTVSMNGTGDMTGHTDTIQVGHATTTVSGPNGLSRFATGNINIPAVRSGDPAGALDLAMQLSGEKRGSNTYSGGVGRNTQLWTLNGHDAGFDADGNRIVSVDDARYDHYELSSLNYLYGQGTVPTPQLFTEPYFSTTTQKTYAKQITSMGPAGGPTVAGGPGGVFADLSDPNTKKVWNFVYPPDKGDEFFDINLGYKEVDVGPAAIKFSMKPSTSELIVTYTSVAAPGENKTLTFDTSALGGEWLVSSTFNWVANTYTLTVNVSVSDVVGLNKTSQTFTAVNGGTIPTLFMQQANEGVPTARMVRRDTIPVAWTGWDTPYEIATAADIQTTPAVSDYPIQGYFGPVWTYLNQVCAGSGTEIALVNNVVALRPLRTETLSIVNRTSQYTVTPQSNKAKKVTLAWSEFRAGNGLTFTPDTVYSVAVGETSEVLIQTANSFTWIPQPKPIEASEFISNLDQIGYAVSGADNLPVPPLEWVDYGGSLQVAPTGVAGELKLTMHGPTTEIPGVPAPYSLAVSDGDTSYPALNIQFWGTTFEEATEKTMNTGAAPSTTTQIEPVSFTSVWATSKERVWGVLANGAKRYAGAYPTLIMTIPTRDVNGFGLCEGSMFRFMNSDYRVSSVTFQIGVTTVTAEPTTTIESFETAWSGKTFAQFETFWSADTYTFTDFTQAPLTTEW